MQASFDFRVPVVVITGHWNMAILDDPRWIAQNILDIPEGRTAELKGFMISDRLETKQLFPRKHIWLFDDYGFGCAEQRIEFYTRDIEGLDTVYACLDKMIDLLPHTPVSALGVNFKVRIEDEDYYGLSDRVETKEEFSSVGVAESQMRKEKIDLWDRDTISEANSGRFPTVLNLSRNVSKMHTEIDFNYNTLIDSMKTLSVYSGCRPVGHWYEHAGRVLKDVYDLSKTENTYIIGETYE